VNKKTTVHFGGLPAVSFRCPIPSAQGKAVQYSNLSVGSDDTLFLAAPSKIEVEVEHDDRMPHYQVVALAYRMLLRAVAQETWEEFKALRQRIIDEAQAERQVSL
jgi:hypothetical protein